MPHWSPKGLKQWRVPCFLGFFFSNWIILTLSHLPAPHSSLSEVYIPKHHASISACAQIINTGQIQNHLSRDSPPSPAQIWFHPALLHACFPGSLVLSPSDSILTLLGSPPIQDLIYLSRPCLSSLVSTPVPSAHRSINASHLVPSYLSAQKTGITY